MKIEIEVTPEEIKSAVERKVRLAIADQTTGYQFDNHLRDMVKKIWKEEVDKLIVEQIADSENIKKKILEHIEATLKRKINKLMETK